MSRSKIQNIDGRAVIIKREVLIESHTGYNAEFIQDIKTIPDRQWHPKKKMWTVPCEHEEDLIHYVNKHYPNNWQILNDKPWYRGKTRFIYFFRLQGTNYVKIGYSTDPKRRAASIRYNAYPDKREITILAFRPTRYPEKMESYLHKKFNKYRVSGEWFDLPRDTIEQIRKLGKRYRWREV